MQTKLNIFGVKVLINSDTDIANWLEHDYGYYSSFYADKPTLVFNLVPNLPDYNKLPALKASKYHDDYIVYESKSLRLIDYFGQALVIYRIKNKVIDVYSASKDGLYDVFYCAFETLVGEELDNLGFHRIHCLGIERKGKAALLLLPPGAGKSTLAFKFLENKNFKVLSEDIVLFKKGMLYGLHFRWGTRDLSKKGRLMKRDKYFDKVLVSAKGLDLAVKARPCEIILGRRVLSSNSRLFKIGKFGMFMPLFKSMVLGLELQQSLAYFLLRNYKEGFSKASIGFSRFFAMLSVLYRSKTYSFEMGSSIEKNYSFLDYFLK